MSPYNPYIFPGPAPKYGAGPTDAQIEAGKKRYAEIQSNREGKAEARDAAADPNNVGDSGVAGPGQEEGASTASSGEDYLKGAQTGDFSDSTFEEGNWVYRKMPTTYDIPYGVGDPSRGNGSEADGVIGDDDVLLRNGELITNKATTGDFTAEYQERLLNGGQEFRDWLARRAQVVFQKDLYPDEGGFDVISGEQVWGQIGAWTASNPNIRDNYTPEQYADKLYNGYGGNDAYDMYIANKTAEDEEEYVNPITRTQSTTTTTVPKASAEAMVDDLSRGLLGRMANAKELARYRAKINAFLAANPDVVTSVRDETDPSQVIVTNERQAGATAQDAASALEMKLRRGSEGTAYNVGQMFEDALSKMDGGF